MSQDTSHDVASHLQRYDVASHLQRAASCLAHVRATDTAGFRSEMWNDDAVVLPAERSLEVLPSRRLQNRLQALRRSLEEAALLASAVDEDQFVNVALRQYERALDAQAHAESSCEREEKCVRDLRANICELERTAARTCPPSSDREVFLEGQIPRLESYQAKMEAEFRTISQRLRESTARNFAVQANIDMLTKAIHAQILADARAMAELGAAGDIKMYRARKEHDRSSAEELLLKAQGRAEEETRRLGVVLSEQRARCNADLEQLGSEYEALQSCLRQRKREVEESLQQFSDQQLSEVDEANGARLSERRRFEEIREQKARALEEQVQRNQKRLAEATDGTQSYMQAQIKDLQTDFQARYRLVDAHCARRIEAEHSATKLATIRAAKWEKQARRLRRNYDAATLSTRRLLHSNCVCIEMAHSRDD